MSLLEWRSGPGWWEHRGGRHQGQWEERKMVEILWLNSVLGEAGEESTPERGTAREEAEAERRRRSPCAGKGRRRGIRWGDWDWPPSGTNSFASVHHSCWLWESSGIIVKRKNNCLHSSLLLLLNFQIILWHLWENKHQFLGDKSIAIPCLRALPALRTVPYRKYIFNTFLQKWIKW